MFLTNIYENGPKMEPINPLCAARLCLLDAGCVLNIG